MADTQNAVMLSEAEVADKNLPDAADYIGALMDQTRALARQRGQYIMAGVDAAYKVYEMLSQLQPYVERMANRREWAAMSLIQRCQSAVHMWLAAQTAVDNFVATFVASDTVQTVEADEQYQTLSNAVNGRKLDVHSHLVHLAQRMPRTVRGDEQQTRILRALVAITAATRYAPVEYVPEGTDRETGRQALARIAQAESDAQKRRSDALARREQRLLETAQAVQADKQAADSSN